MLSPEDTKFLIEPLCKDHEKARAAFSCGQKDLDFYLQRQAGQDQRKHLAVPYLAIDKEHQKIIGFYTLSSQTVILEEWPETVAKKLRYQSIGVTLVGRLAIALTYQKKGWGKLLLMDALSRSLEVSEQVGSFAVIVEAKDDTAVAFYQRFDFKAFPNQPYKLFRVMSEIAKAFS